MKKRNASIASWIACATAAWLLTDCNNNATTATTNDSTGTKTETTEKKAGDIPDLKPTTPKPDWGKDLTDNMHVVLDKLASYGDPPLETLGEL